MTATARPRIVLFTSQDIGFQIVDGLARRGDCDLVVVTCRTVRDDSYGYRSAIDAAAAHGIEAHVATRVDEALMRRIAAFAPDLIFSAYFPHVIPRAVFGLSRRPAVNIHPGVLPLYRGKFPVPWYILNGEREFGLAIHEIDDGIDTGPVLVQERFPIDPDETGHGLYRKTMDRGAELVLGRIGDILAGKITPRPQSGTGTYFSTIDRRYVIDWNLPRETILRRIRVHARPYFPAHGFILNHMVLIDRARAVEPAGFRAQAGGSVLSLEPDGGFVVSCCDGAIHVERCEIAPDPGPDGASRVLMPGARFETA